MRIENIIHSTLFGLIVGFILYVVECIVIYELFNLHIDNNYYLVQYYLIFQSTLITIVHYKLFYKDL